MKKIILSLILLSTFYFLFSILIAQAAEKGLVPCGPGIVSNKTCTFCHLLILGQNIINYALIIVFPISAVMVVVGGGFILTAGASESNVAKGKEILTAAIIGLIIALSSWLIIDIIIRAISNDTNTNWYEIGSKVGCS